MNRGFTLLEMIVSLALFSIVALVAVSALTRIVGLNRQAQTLHAAMNNLGFALESMSRELRVGSNFHCETIPASSYAAGPGAVTFQACPIVGSPDPTAGNSEFITFQSTKKDMTCAGTPYLLYAYMFTPKNSTSWSLQKAQQANCSQVLTKDSFTPVLDEGNVNLTDYRLSVTQGTIDPSIPNFNLAYIRLAGYAGIRVKDQNYFDIETSVSERIADIP
jgi:prepilin-type N-terminal cleavage/methylation domain-containing protein